MKYIYQANGATLAEQYRDMGALFGESIRKTVKSIARRTAKKSLIRRQVAEKSLDNLSAHKEAREFLACLKAWAEGAQITSYQAMWLMADNLTGCQTLMVRYKSGVAMLHTEEDFDDMSLHMTGEQVASFDDHGELSRCLVYNDLLPGAGLYGWKHNLIVAVDTLFLKEDEIEKVQNPLLANVLAWMIWRMTPEEAAPEKILKLANKLGELVDGYAINVVRKVGDVTSGFKLTLARTESYLENLGDNPGDYLRQVNIVDPKYPPMRWASHPRNIWRGGYKYFLARLATMDLHVAQFKYLTLLALSNISLSHIHSDVQKAIYTDLSPAYINENVGAVCVGLVDKVATSVSCKLNDKQTFDELEYIDVLD